MNRKLVLLAALSGLLGASSAFANESFQDTIRRYQALSSPGPAYHEAVRIEAAPKAERPVFTIADYQALSNPSGVLKTANAGHDAASGVETVARAPTR